MDLVYRFLICSQRFLVLLRQLEKVVLVEQSLLVGAQRRKLVEFVESVSKSGLLTIYEFYALLLHELSEKVFQLFQGFIFVVDQVVENFFRGAASVLLEGRA